MRTALDTSIFAQEMYKYAKPVGGEQKRIYFTCACGKPFSLSTEYDVYRASQLRCPSCKRNVKADIGERAVFKRVKSDANRAGRTFDLPFEWFKHTIHAACHYCGRKDQNSISVPSKRPGEWLIQNFRYNGIDRLNNGLGYEIHNCVPCCFVCNRAKQSMSYGEFMHWIEDMIQYRGNH